MISKENFVDFFFLLGFSYTNTDDSHDSRVSMKPLFPNLENVPSIETEYDQTRWICI